MHHLQRLIDDAHGHQRLVDHPGGLQQHQPGISAGEQAGPHRQQHDVEDPAPPSARHQGDRPGQREAQQQAEQRHQAGHREGVEQHPRIGRVGEQLLIVAQARHRFQHAAQQQANQRREKEQAEKQQGGDQVTGATPTLFQRRRGLLCNGLADCRTGSADGAPGGRGRTRRGCRHFHLTSHSFHRVAMAGPFLAQYAKSRVI
ncbi:hypothetical protein D3C76_1229770 [compost metagenome]